MNGAGIPIASIGEWDVTPACHHALHPPCIPLRVTSLPSLQQSLVVVDKDSEGQVKTKSLMGVRYVPLTPPTEMDDGFVWVPP